VTDSRLSFQVDGNDDLFCCEYFCFYPYPARSQSDGGVIHSESLNDNKYIYDFKGSPEEAVVGECVSEVAMIIIAIRRTSTIALDFFCFPGLPSGVPGQWRWRWQSKFPNCVNQSEVSISASTETHCVLWMSCQKVLWPLPADGC
jgi:hypothetical protein